MGRDKGLIDLKGRPMISYVLETLGNCDLPVSIIAHDPNYERFGTRVFQDIIPEKGPMGGLLTAFENTVADIVLLVSCDMPFITEKAVEKLVYRANDNQIVTAVENESINPLFATYPVNLKEKVGEAIRKGDLKMKDFILQNPHVLLPSLEQDFHGIFKNINTEEERRKAEERWKL